MFGRDKDKDDRELRELREEVAFLRAREVQQAALIREQSEEIEILAEAVLKLSGKQVLSSIKIAFSQGDNMAAVQGPVTLAAGAVATASVLGFDQLGRPWTGAIPPVTYAIDDSTIASSAPNSDGVTDLVTGIGPNAAGVNVANLKASLMTAEGLALTDTESVTVTSVVPVLSSIKLAFDTSVVTANARK